MSNLICIAIIFLLELAALKSQRNSWIWSGLAKNCHSRMFQEGTESCSASLHCCVLCFFRWQFWASTPYLTYLLRNHCRTCVRTLQGGSRQQGTAHDTASTSKHTWLKHGSNHGDAPVSDMAESIFYHDIFIELDKS